MQSPSDPLVRVRNLRVSFRLDGTRRSRRSRASRSTSRATRTVALVGESGSGKSVTSLAILGLLPPENSIVDPASEILLRRPQPRRRCRARELRDLRGADISMIFQEPMTSLNPVFTVGYPARGSAAAAHGLTGARRASARSSCWTKSAFPSPTCKINAYPVADVGRPAAARDDRDGDRVRAQAPDRRRADDRARRHDPEADPRPDRASCRRSTRCRCCSSRTISPSSARSPTTSS